MENKMQIQIIDLKNFLELKEFINFLKIMKNKININEGNNNDEEIYLDLIDELNEKISFLQRKAILKFNDKKIIDSFLNQIPYLYSEREKNKIMEEEQNKFLEKNKNSKKTGLGSMIIFEPYIDLRTGERNYNIREENFDLPIFSGIIPPIPLNEDDFNNFYDFEEIECEEDDYED